MLDGMSDSIQGSRIENLQSREVDRQSPTGLILEDCNLGDYGLKYSLYNTVNKVVCAPVIESLRVLSQRCSHC